MINNINAPAGPYATCCMILILEGNSQQIVHMWSKTGSVFRSFQVTTSVEPNECSKQITKLTVHVLTSFWVTIRYKVPWPAGTCNGVIQIFVIL